ncbi:hypothetical protein [Roseibium sp.]|uniref:hypothetical protein n=1 Tax=Roseibium sp. TaxID=1936156 RepID=UPI003A972D5D
MTKKFLVAGLLALLTPLPLTAQPAAPDPQALMTPAFIDDVRDWLANPIVNLSITAQNQLRGQLAQDGIDALDKQWRAERENDDKPLISATLSAPLSSYLLRVQAGATGLYTEIFIMDSNGLNVGQSAITGDYWQGDEAKFQKTFSVAPDAVFIDEAEWDEERKIWRAQLNLAIADQTSGKAIGAATVEVNLTELQRRGAAAS